MEGCTVDKDEGTLSFARWAYDEAMRRWEIIMHPYTDLTVEPIWYLKEPVIEPLMSILMQNDHIVDPGALSRFTWERDFYDILADKWIVWTDSNSLKEGHLHTKTKLGGAKDNTSDNIRALIHRHRQGSDIVARLSPGESNGCPLLVSQRGLRLAQARRELRNNKRVSRQVAPWFPENAEVDAIFDAWQRNILLETKRVPHDNIDNN
ncbi:hypothetical protein NOF04DRAFT_1255 [Fusarium oxysporum II5]|nr:uncharacterized protein FOIG_00801 [Fusarium odoratissimum NRRL 54006]EXM10902.1 hypothetical protein FOIG_00801 [Fusarium odoratissimum NRRL 54006]KAK2137148.1 hypothetical protein NOF04DRAFT_1255 [Fusarium oxysporum II5]